MFKKATSILGIIISLIILAGLTFYISYWRGINQPAQTYDESSVFTVEPDWSVPAISDNLQKQGFIKYANYFNLYVSLKHLDTKLQAGEYLLNKNMNIREIVNILAKGEIQNREKTIKIIEGWDIKDIAHYLKAQDIIGNEDDFIQLTKHEADTCFAIQLCQASFLNQIPEQATLEGYLFPDTYRIFNNATSQDIIAKMLNNTDTKITEQMKQDIKKQGKTLHEILTMASIIEKEVRTPEDMKTVSGIFYNRIALGMPLQSDATLSYALDDEKPAHSNVELDIDSPYNTYKYPGLPPAPIANPGINAINAAIYPAKTDYLFFLSNLKTGETYFAKTLAEHNSNKALHMQ